MFSGRGGFRRDLRRCALDSRPAFPARRLLVPRSGRGLAVALAALVAFPFPDSVLAQAPATPATAPAPPGGDDQAAPKLKPEQLEALVAPIALYPDPLLSQALMASTYPLEIIQAQQWLAKNKGLKADVLEKAVQEENWDPSVQATALMPDLLKRLAEDITWTTNLGNAFLAQQQDVMDAVQRLRMKAKDTGKLESNDKMKVETKVVEQETVVVIQPASPQVIYVPAYNPTVIWGPPPYPYPPVYYPPPPPPGAMLFTFTAGMMMGAAMHGGYCCGCGWGHSNTVVINNNNTFVNNSNRVNNVNAGSGNSNWQHNSQHRGGAPYGDRATASKYGGNTRSGSGGGQQARAAPSTMDRGGAGGGGAGGGSAGRGASPSTSDRSRGGGSGGGGGYGGSSPGSASIGNRSTSPSSGGSGFGGSSGGASRAQASSSRGASSMNARPPSGGGRGGGGGGRGGGGRR
jgi:hypothetical protein